MVINGEIIISKTGGGGETIADAKIVVRTLRKERETWRWHPLNGIPARFQSLRDKTENTAIPFLPDSKTAAAASTASLPTE